MIYKVLLKSDKPSKAELSHKAEGVLSYGLYREKGINYENEVVIKNPWGKPSLKNYPNLDYNISHSDNCIVCIISDSHEVGIDVERVRIHNPYAAKKVCGQEELERIYSKEDSDREFFRYWTLKESYVKAIGRGVSWPMKNINFIIEGNGSIKSNKQDCHFEIIEEVEGFIIAACYKNI